MEYEVKQSKEYEDRWAIVYKNEVLMDNLFSKQQALKIAKCLKIAHEKGVEETQAQFAASIWKMLMGISWIKPSK
jgi:hypothetical protein